MNELLCLNRTPGVLTTTSQPGICWEGGYATHAYISGFSTLEASERLKSQAEKHDVVCLLADPERRITGKEVRHSEVVVPPAYREDCLPRKLRKAFREEKAQAFALYDPVPARRENLHDAVLSMQPGGKSSVEGTKVI